MGFIKKIWKDRISEFPTRRSLTKPDGTSELVTVARSEGMISEEGDAFSAENMNDLENRVEEGFSELNEKTQCGTFDFTISQQEAAYVVQFPKEFKKIPVVTLSIERGGFTTTTFYHIQNGYNTTKQFAFLAVCTDPGTLNTACKAHWIAREP